MFIICFLVLYQRGHSTSSTTPSPAKKLTINQYLTRYGYMANYDGPPPAGQRKSAIEKFQSYARLPVTGVMDKATIGMLTGPRCGQRDNENTPPRLKRYVKDNTKWNKLDLTWSIHGSLRPRSKIPSSVVSSSMARTFKMWKDVSKLSFRRLADNDNNADIIIKFVAGYHGDFYAFDGRGGTLAHAYYPGSNKGIAGDIHFDDDEIWTTNGEQGTTDFTWTALHEIGHSLGLRHSRESDAVMWPWFTGYTADTKLTQDDINGIQDIYGKPTVTVTTTKKPQPSVCNIRRFDAIFYDSRTRKTYFLQGKYVWEMNERKRITGGQLISSKWPGLESNLDSAYMRKSDGHIIFFKGSRYWRYRGNIKVTGPSVLSGYIKNHQKVRLNKIDAVMVWKGSAVDLVYFFTGSLFWRYDERRLKIATTKYSPFSPYPRTSSRYWHGIPFPIGGILTWRNDITYFFKNGYVYKYKYKKSSRRYNGKILKKHFIKNCRD